jgi:glycerol-3-phosphate acyltransferase PlsX
VSGSGAAPSGAEVRVALDGRGAERGAEAIVGGIRAVAGEGIDLVVFGDPDELVELRELTGVELIAAADEITNDDEPVAAVRSRPDASVVRAADAVADGEAQALVSAGSTGATMTAALFALRRAQGVRRPALAVQLPAIAHRGPPTVMLDVGANTDARAGDLVQFAHLGAAFSEAVLAVPRPRVALLSIGEEAKKGTPAIVEAHSALAPSESLRFSGNLEGRDLLAGDADVVVCDGFTGNVALKTLEGTASAVGGAVRDAARANPVSALGGLMLRPALGGLRRAANPDATGGAILLGLRGTAVVAHGSSGAEGIANAIRLAARCVRERAVERTAELLERAGATRGAMRREKIDA